MPGTGGFWQCCLQPGSRWNWNGLPKGWEWIRLPCARHWNGSGEAGLPFELLELEENVQLATAEEYGDLIRSVLSQKRSTPLSQSAMEVLAIIAYNQPVTRAFVEQIRGVDSSSAVNSLVVRDLVEEAGRLELPGRPIAYRTTANFLRCFGLQSLDELPDITAAAQAQEQPEQLSLTPADGQGEEP